MKEYVTFRLWKKTHKFLKRIHAETGESIIAIIDRLAREEWVRVKDND